MRPYTVEAVMTSSVPTVDVGATAADIEQLLLRKAKAFETIDYIYVLDANRVLVGVLSVRDVFSLPKTTRVFNVMVKDIVRVHPHQETRHAALLALTHNLKAIPVVDKAQKFLGIIGHDEILRTLHELGIKRILGSAGIHPQGNVFDNVLELPIWKSIFHRLPWLLVGLGGGIFAARIISGFETMLAENLVLASFIPLVVYMADAVQTQTEAYIIRDLALNHTFNFFHYFFRHTLVIVSIGAMVGVALALIALLGYGVPAIGMALGISLFAAITSSIFTGFLIPYSIWKFRLDPANVSGPIGTILQDIISVAIYFTVASSLLS